MDDFLLHELQNQKLSDSQIAAIENAESFYDKVIAVLKTVHDPEISVNIWDLGLIYALDVSPDNDVSINMTLTAPTCPVAEAIPTEVEKRLKQLLPAIGKININMVWEPAWSKDMMSEEAKLILDMW